MKLVMDQCVKEADATIDAQGPIEAVLDLYHYCLLKDYTRTSQRPGVGRPDRPGSTSKKQGTGGGAWRRPG